MKKKLTKTEADAEFLGWQQNHKGEPLTLYNITRKDHPSYGSTVSEDTINELNLKMPEVIPKRDSFGIPENETNNDIMS